MLILRIIVLLVYGTFKSDRNVKLGCGAVYAVLNIMPEIRVHRLYYYGYICFTLAHFFSA